MRVGINEVCTGSDGKWMAFSNISQSTDWFGWFVIYRHNQRYFSPICDGT